MMQANELPSQQYSEQDVTPEQKAMIDEIIADYFQERGGILSGIELKSKNMAFLTSIDAVPHDRVYVNLVTESSIHSSLAGEASGALSIVCERANDELSKVIEHHPGWNEKKETLRPLQLSEDFMKIVIAKGLLKDLQDPYTQKILKTLEERAHSSIFFIMKVSKSFTRDHLGSNAESSGEKWFSKIPKELITHILIPNPTTKSNTNYFNDAIPGSNAIIRFVGSKQERITLNFGVGFAISDVEVNCPDYESSLSEVFEIDKQSRFRLYHPYK